MEIVLSFSKSIAFVSSCQSPLGNIFIQNTSIQNAASCFIRPGANFCTFQVKPSFYLLRNTHNYVCFILPYCIMLRINMSTYISNFSTIGALVHYIWAFEVEKNCLFLAFWRDMLILRCIKLLIRIYSVGCCSEQVCKIVATRVLVLWLAIAFWYFG